MFDPVLFAALMGSTALFSPSALFSSGEQGAWYDPSDFSTMFQESTGVTPVTAVEQPVGLILDKSKSLAVGTELVSPINFTTGWTFSGGPVTFDSASTYTAAAVANVYQAFFTVGKWYKLTINVTFTSAAVLLYNATSALNLINQTTIVSGTSYTCYFLAAATQLNIRPTSAGVVTVNSITVQEVAGNHASQSTAASRPVLSARVNLLTYSEDQTNAAWSALSGGTGSAPIRTANYAASPFGTQTATRVQFNKGAGATSGDYCLIYQSTTSTSAATRTIWIKSNTGSTQNLILYDNQNPSAGTLQIAATTSWQKFTLSNAVAEGACLFVLGLRGGAGYGGDNSVDVLIWGADLRVTNDGVGIPAYQRVAAATDYDTSGFPLYLRFDGTDDSLSTASIDFSATDKMSVFAGARKLSDIGDQAAIETSSAASANNGTISLFAPVSSGTNYNFGSRGTTFRSTSATGFAAPITTVVTGLSDISGDSVVIRANGSQASSSILDQGTGNYGNYPLYIGRRNNATLPFNGRLYSLIVRGAQSTDAQIASTETWVNGKTGAY